MILPLQRALAIAALPVTLALLLAACGDGLESDQAKKYCDHARTVDACMTDATYQSCMSCYEECGVSCKESDGCPRTFACED